MKLVCFDLEGVFVGEIWIEFAEATGIEELRITTRDEPDYDKLMNYRIGILREHGLGLAQIQQVIETMEPLEGARAFLDELRTFAQVIVVSDTFAQFAGPLMAKLGYPTLLCNELIVDDDGMVTGFQMRKAKNKKQVTDLLHDMGYDIISCGDSFNDLAMIQSSSAGFLFRTTEQLKADYPDIPAFDSYDELLAAIKAEL